MGIWSIILHSYVIRESIIVLTRVGIKQLLSKSRNTNKKTVLKLKLTALSVKKLIPTEVLKLKKAI